MIVVVEGPSAAGKTTWSSGAPQAQVVPEHGRVDVPTDVMGNEAAFWADLNGQRWTRALAVEAAFGRAICDGDPLKLHYDYCLARIGLLPWTRFHAGVEACAGAIEDRHLGLAVARRREGLAILSPQDWCEVRSWTLRSRPPWDWRRRIAVAAATRVDGMPVSFVNLHLSPHGADAQRVTEARKLLSLVREWAPQAVIPGDLNGDPTSAVMDELVSAGWVDAWAATNSDEVGATSWRVTIGEHLPGRRIDYVLAPPGVTVLGSSVPVELAEARRLSDHVPVLATLRFPSSL